MLFNASTTPCNLQCSTIVSNLFCCDEIFLPGLFFKKKVQELRSRAIELSLDRPGRRRQTPMNWEGRS